MKSPFKCKTISLICLMILFSAIGQARYQVGDTVADFELPDIDQTLVRLSDFCGRIILITFWQFG